MSMKRATMRAAALDRFGGVENIHVKQLPVPEPGPDESCSASKPPAWVLGSVTNAKANSPKCSAPTPTFPYMLGSTARELSPQSAPK